MVTAANPGVLSGQAVHFANDFGNVPEQTMSITARSTITLHLPLSRPAAWGRSVAAVRAMTSISAMCCRAAHSP